MQNHLRKYHKTLSDLFAMSFVNIYTGYRFESEIILGTMMENGWQVKPCVCVCTNSNNNNKTQHTHTKTKKTTTKQYLSYHHISQH
jgi:hypothetical protein